jgi:hypothetical protein
MGYPVIALGLLAPDEEAVSGLSLRVLRGEPDTEGTLVPIDTDVRWNKAFRHVNLPIPLEKPLQVNSDDVFFGTRLRSLQEAELYGISFPVASQNFLGVINGVQMKTGKTGNVQSVTPTTTQWGYSVLNSSSSKDTLRIREIIQRQVAQYLLHLIENGSVEQLVQFSGTSLMKELPFRDINGRFTPYGAEELRIKVRERLWDQHYIWVPWFRDMLDSRDFIERPDVQNYLQKEWKMTL